MSVILPMFDRTALSLARCLNGLLARTAYRELEVLVVDNGVEEARDLCERLKSVDSRVRVIEAPGAFGCAAVNNCAARCASGRILLLLNNTVEVLEAGWLREMVSHAVRPDVGAVGAKLLYADGTILHAGVVLGIGGDGIGGRLFCRTPATHPGYWGSLNLVRSVSAVSGACLALRREVFEAVGGLDETNLPVAYNDIDLCLRISERGLRIVWTPFAQLVDLEIQTPQTDDGPEKAARLEQEGKYMKQRWNTELETDPYYNVNLSLERNDCGFGPPPRRARPWTHDPLLPAGKRSVSF